jgi:hypothetical protein
VTLSKASVKAVATALKGQEEVEEISSDDSDEEVAMKPPSKKQKIVKNRNNPALKHRGGE